jgi:hypothetical protein
MRIVLAMILAPALASADPFIGGRIGVRSANENNVDEVGPLLEVEGGGFATRWLALSAFVRYEKYDHSVTSYSPCSEYGPSSTLQCSATDATTRNHLALGVRGRAFVTPWLSLGGTFGVVREYQDETLTDNAMGGGTNTFSTTIQGSLVEANVAYVHSLGKWQLEALAEVGYSWLAWSTNDPVTPAMTGNGTWIGVSVGGRYR